MTQAAPASAAESVEVPQGGEQAGAQGGVQGGVQSAAPEVGQHAARGFAWMTVQSVLSQVASVAQQLTLAYLLVPKDFALVGQTYSITLYAAFFQQFGLKQVLVQRAGEFDRWATPAFWMSAGLGLFAGGLTAASGPAAASYYGRPEMVGLMLVAALNLPISSLNTVPEGKMVAGMRFKILAIFGIVGALLALVLTVAFAFLGWGAYAVIAPMSIVSVVRVVAFWWISGVRIRWRPEFREWRHLVGDGASMMIGTLAMMVTLTGHIAVLGRAERGSGIVGQFYFAFNASDQGVRALMLNLSAVLFPALATLWAEPLRQSEAFRRAIRGLMIVGIPVCFAQALLAPAAVRLVLKPQWAPAIPLFVILSIAMVGRLIAGPCDGMMLAMRRQRTWMWYALGYAACFVGLAAAGTLLGRRFLAGGLVQDTSAASGIGCAVGVAVALNLAAPISMLICHRPVGGGWRWIVRDYRAPLGASAVGAGVALGATWWLPVSVVGDLARILLGGACLSVVYLLLIRRWAHADIYDLLGRARRILPSRVRAWVERRAERHGERLGEAMTPTASPPPPPPEDRPA